MTWSQRLGQWLIAACSGLCIPFRAMVSLDGQQVRSLFSVAMLGGIVALSTQNMALIMLVRELLRQAGPGSLFGQMALTQQFWNNVIITLFAVSLALIVWGAAYLRAKYGNFELATGADAETEDTP